MKKMQHIEEIKDYWNLRANGFSLAVEEELRTESGERMGRDFSEIPSQKKNAAVLDDGTGAGFFPVILSRLGHQVTAIDYSDEMTAQAEEAVQRSRGRGSGSVRWMPRSWNLQMKILMRWCPEMYCGIWMIRRQLTGKCTGCLRPGGKLIIWSDGNMYLYMHDEEYARLHEKQMEEMKKKQESGSQPSRKTQCGSCGFFHY